MKKLPVVLFIALYSCTFLASCNKDDDEDGKNNSTPTATMQYYFTGKINGVDTHWQADNIDYKMTMAPTNSNNVSVNNNYIRYGTSIYTNIPAKYPFICLEFSGFLGNTIDKVSPSTFISYFHTGNYSYTNNANKDTAAGVNILYEMDANYQNFHETSNATQPSSSYFNIDSVQVVQETNKTTKMYIKARFNATLTDPDKPGNDMIITDGVLRVLIDNFLEG